MRFTYQKAVQFNSICTHVLDLHKKALSQIEETSLNGVSVHHQNFPSLGSKLTRLGVSALIGEFQ